MMYVKAKLRNYKQHDDLYDLIGRLAEGLETSRTTIVELAVADLAERLDANEEGLHGKMAGRAREVDAERRSAGALASLDAREKQGTIVRRRKVGL